MDDAYGLRCEDLRVERAFSVCTARAGTYMNSKLRIALYDDTVSRESAFREPFDACEQVTVERVFDGWDALQLCLAEGTVDVIAVNLDCPGGMKVVEKCARLIPECGVLGVSSRTESLFIIGAMRSGCSQYVCWPVEAEDLNNAIYRMKPIVAKPLVGSRTICVVGSSGGAGATMLACNLAMELQCLSGEDVALVDMNLEFGDVACSFDVNPRYSIADICHEGIELDETSVSAVLERLPCGVSIVARPDNVEDARDVSLDGVEQMFGLLGRHYNNIVVDLPRSFNFLSAVCIGRADHILIVTQLGVPFIRNASRIYHSLISMGADDDRVHIVLNRWNAEFDRISIKDVEQHFRRPVFAVIPNDYQYVSASLDLGHPIGADAPTSKARTAIQEMALKIAPEYAMLKAGIGVAGSGLLGKLFGRKP